MDIIGYCINKSSVYAYYIHIQKSSMYVLEFSKSYQYTYVCCSVIGRNKAIYSDDLHKLKDRGTFSYTYEEWLITYNFSGLEAFEKRHLLRLINVYMYVHIHIYIYYVLPLVLLLWRFKLSVNVERHADLKTLILLKPSLRFT